jgi:DNA-binding MarR family transcriptional regulator
VAARRRDADLRAGSEVRDLGCACATARQAARALTQLYDARLRATGIEAPQFALMMTLHNEGPESQAAIGRRYAIDKTTLSRNLKVLQRKGWIEASEASDRRERRFTLTAAGRKLLAAARPEWRKSQDELRSSMTPEEWDSMFRVFRMVVRAAERAGGAIEEEPGTR